MNGTYHYDSPLGGITIACNGIGLTGLWFDGQKYFEGALSAVICEKMTDIFRETVSWLDMYFSGDIPDFTPPISLNSTTFRVAVWNILKSIPYGKT